VQGGKPDATEDRGLIDRVDRPCTERAWRKKERSTAQQELVSNSRPGRPAKTSKLAMHRAQLTAQSAVEHPVNRTSGPGSFLLGFWIRFWSVL